MIQNIRDKAGSTVVKILFALLIMSFGVWGIGDIFRERNATTTVATVGDHTIRAEELAQSVRTEMERMRSMFGGGIDLDQARQLGIVDGALEELVNRQLIDQEIDRLGLAVGDDTLRNAILGNPSFHGPAGAFDRGAYMQVLTANHYTEPQYEALMREAIARNNLSDAVVAGGIAPPLLAEELYRRRSEKRVADTVFLPGSAAGDVGTPSDTDLAAFYDKHQDQFRAPELRSFKVATLKPDDLAAGIEVPDSKLHDEYQNRQDDFRTPERRELQQILVPDEAKAKAAAAAIAGGKDFVAVAQEMGQTPDTTNIGWTKHDDMPGDLGDAAFALEKGQVSAPLQSSFGWHILRVTGIEPAAVKPFEDAKAELKAQIARDMAADSIAKTENEIDDALAAGSSFDDVVAKFKLQIAKVEGVDLSGHDAAGTAVTLPTPSDQILKTAFATESGQNSSISEIQDGGFYMLHVDQVTPPAVKPLAAVKDQAIAAWQAEQRNAALEKQATELVDAVKGGKSLKALAEERKLALTTTPPLPRTGAPEAKVPPTLVARLFEIAPQAATMAPGDDGYYVAELMSIEPADPKADKAEVAQLNRQTSTAMQGDLMSQFQKALRGRYPVTIDRAAVDRAI